MDLKANIKNIRKNLDYLYEEKRLATFKKWVFGNDCPCNAAKLAEAGFIFVGSELEPDAVKCFYCDKMLDGWESTDDPWKEHLDHSKNCAFAELQQPEYTLTIRQFIQIKEDHFKKIAFNNPLEEQRKHAKERFDKTEEKLLALL